MSDTDKKTFLITGVSSGFGHAFACAALDAGHTVLGTLRTEAAATAFQALHPTRAHPILLDVTDFAAVAGFLQKIDSRIGPIDVLVNNAGYGHEGILEESSLDEMRRQFEVNVFGAVAMIQAVLPQMRQRRAGHIVNVTSMGGYITMPGISYYCGSKFALEGISDTLAKEVKAFGIKVSAVAPGSFRTEWAGKSMVRSERRIADYDALFDPIRQGRAEKSGHQPGDPRKAAQALLLLVALDEPPVHLLLGSDALALVSDHLKQQAENLARWEAITRSTDG